MKMTQIAYVFLAQLLSMQSFQGDEFFRLTEYGDPKVSIWCHFVRGLGFVNHANMGSYREVIDGYLDGQLTAGCEASKPAPEAAVSGLDDAGLGLEFCVLKSCQYLPIHAHVVYTHPAAKPTETSVMKVHNCKVSFRGQIPIAEAKRVGVPRKDTLQLWTF